MYARSPDARAVRARERTAGFRSSSSNAHASPVAVVSWPATSSVTSSSRSSLSVIASPSSSRASSSIENTSSRSARSGASRRRAISSKISSSTAARRSSKRWPAPLPKRPPERASAIRPRRVEVGSIISLIRRLSSSSRGPSSTPKTARRITSSVSERIEGISVNSRPTGHEPIAVSAASVITRS